jgi:hypothetical protein
MARDIILLCQAVRAAQQRQAKDRPSPTGMGWFDDIMKGSR